MREVRLSDAELQKLIGTALRARLRAGGLQGVTASDHCGTAMFPINLDLAGSCSVARDEDGFWTFTQEVDEIAMDRTRSANESHIEAVGARLAAVGERS